jgi:hypothetical protein
MRKRQLQQVHTCPSGVDPNDPDLQQQNEYRANELQAEYRISLLLGQ